MAAKTINPSMYPSSFLDDVKNKTREAMISVHMLRRMGSRK